MAVTRVCSHLVRTGGAGGGGGTGGGAVAFFCWAEMVAAVEA